MFIPTLEELLLRYLTLLVCHFPHAQFKPVSVVVHKTEICIPADCKRDGALRLMSHASSKKIMCYKDRVDFWFPDILSLFIWVSDTYVCLLKYYNSVRELRKTTSVVHSSTAVERVCVVVVVSVVLVVSPLHHPSLGKVELGKKCGMSGPRHKALRLHWIFFFFFFPLLMM